MGNSYDFTKSKIPEEIVLDSSVLLNTVQDRSKSDSGQQRIYDATTSFLRRLQSAILNKESYAFAPPQVVTECFHIITLHTISGILGSTFDAIAEYKKRPDLITTCKVPEKIKSFVSLVDDLGIEFLQPNDIPPSENDVLNTFEDEMAKAMKDFLLLFADANIVTVSNRLKIVNLASVDKDFLSLSRKGNFNIYTAPTLVTYGTSKR